jgi:two-component system LytT family response regulator
MIKKDKNKMSNTDNKYKCIIVDDEPQNIAVFEHLCNEFFSNDLEVINTFNIATEALKFINSEKIDIIFLDIEMPNGNAFDLLEKFKEINFNIIFTTAYDHYAIKAIKFSAVDYILKPFEKKDIQSAFDKINNLKNI